MHTCGDDPLDVQVAGRLDRLLGQVGQAEHPRQAVVEADGGDQHPRPRRARARPSSAATVVRPTPPLPLTISSWRAARASKTDSGLRLASMRGRTFAQLARGRQGSVTPAGP
jgi:hypothetical protein